MLDRLEAGYRFRFDALERVAPPGERQALSDPKGAAQRRAAASGRPVARELLALYLAARAEVARELASRAGTSLFGVWRAEVQRHGGRVAEPPVFVCDASLGGLARWIRAAGYEARWQAGGGGLERVGQALAEAAVLLTSDSRALAFGAIRDRRLLALWMPSSLGHLEQLALLLGDLGLEARESRCMSCGGGLVRVEKASVRARIPPRTALWKEEYRVCSACHRLYWQGTHWERIAAGLRSAASDPARTSGAAAGRREA